MPNGVIFYSTHISHQSEESSEVKKPITVKSSTHISHQSEESSEVKKPITVKSSELSDDHTVSGKH